MTIKGNGGSTRIDTTNANCDVLAVGNYQINADDSGVNISWTGYDGNNYETEKIDWDTFKANKYTLEMSDYFGDPSDGVNDNLYDVNGKPVFKYQIALNVQETATKDDIIKCIDGTNISPSEYVSISGKFEDNISRNGVMSVYSTNLQYAAAYASNANGQNNNSSTTISPDTYGYDFDAADDTFLEPADNSGNKLTSGGSNLISYPKATTVADAKSSADKWIFSFTMDGIGPVKATSSSISYGANDRTDDDEGLWWNWVKPSNSAPYKSGISRSAGGTLAGVMSVLTGDKGLLNKNNPAADGKGAADSGGYIRINFNLTSDNSYTYGNGLTSNSVGSFTLQISITNKDTEESVLNKINNALNGNTIFDLYSTGGTSDYQYAARPYAKNHEIDVPIYGGANRFYVQAGVEAGQHISMKYDCLSIWELGMENTNVLTRETSENAIDEIKSALRVISDQRATFGTYQNRLEHAYNANKNTEENTQASESVIRDADMAKTMVEHSNQNILLQAGQAMLAQANHNSDFILNLLG